jgi:MFS family permease
MTLLGLGQGASISLSLSYIAWRSPDARHTAQVSTMAQGFGYLLASLGPIGIGAVHTASGSWTVPLVVLAALLVPQLIAGVLASRERQVLAPHENTVSRPTSIDDGFRPLPVKPVSRAPWERVSDWPGPFGATPSLPRPYVQQYWPQQEGNITPAEAPG